MVEKWAGGRALTENISEFGLRSECGMPGTDKKIGVAGTLFCCSHSMIRLADSLPACSYSVNLNLLDCSGVASLR